MTRTRPSTLHQEPEAVTWARQKAGLTKRALAAQVGISEQTFYRWKKVYGGMPPSEAREL